MKESMRISLVYIIIAALWIYFSDSALALLNLDVQTMVRVSQFKGFFYVLVTGVLLFLLIKKEINQKNEVIHNLETTIQQKEEVMKELHHRIKNNLQNVISIINLETGEQDVLDGAKERILHKLYALSAIHDMVYNFESFHQISLRPVLENYFSYIAVPVTEENLRIKDTVQYSLEDMVPILLSLNELFEEVARQQGNYHFVINAEHGKQIDILLSSPAINDLILDTSSIFMYLNGSRARASLIHQDGAVTLRISFVE